MDLLNGIKEQFNWTEQDAALEELRQSTRRGYNPERSGGTIKRGLFEGLRDFVLQNDSKEIERLAREEYVKNLKTDLGVEPLNSRLRAAGQDEIQITPGTTKGSASIKTTDAERKLPVLEGITAKGGDTSGLSVNSSDGQLLEALDTASVNRERSQRTSDPDYINALNQQNLTNQMALSQMSLSEQRASNQMQIAMMDNQLDRRRLDMQEKRIDRRDRQAYIQQLMAGLSTLGASIAI